MSESTPAAVDASSAARKMTYARIFIIVACAERHMLATCSYTCSGRLDGDAVGAGNYDGGRHPAEEAVVHHAHRVLELLRSARRIGDRALEEEVDDVVAVVGHSNLIAVDLRSSPHWTPETQS